MTGFGQGRVIIASGKKMGLLVCLSPDDLRTSQTHKSGRPPKHEAPPNHTNHNAPASPHLFQAKQSDCTGSAESIIFEMVYCVLNRNIVQSDFEIVEFNLFQKIYKINIQKMEFRCQGLSSLTAHQAAYATTRVAILRGKITWQYSNYLQQKYSDLKAKTELRHQ
jgi:hypothetical protein